MFRTFLHVLVGYSFFIVAFAMGFYLLLHNVTVTSDQDFIFFDDMGLSVVKTFTMFVGELDVGDIPLADNFESTDVFLGKEFRYLYLLAFVFLIVIVMMNLLVAIAVNDIKQLFKTARRDQLMNQAELINYMERITGFWVFRRLLPSKIQELFKAGVLNGGRGFKMTRDVFYANNNDRSLPEPLKNELYDFCMK